MWCYQKPGFQALLLAELQRQQQGSQFCDTLLKTEGVSVPAHSCILSAISPHISSALSSAPPLPAGQSRLLEFRALGACTLLNVVRLLYCGEMAGEGGEEEKQQAVLAAAKLGIHGLVEVTKERRGEGRCDEGRRTGMSAQTEAPGRNEGKDGRWTREVTDGSVYLWKETPSNGKRDTWTQTEALQVDSDPPSHTAASFETIDMAAFQGLGQGDSHLALPQIPYIPISLIYPPDENQMHPPPSAFANPTGAGLPFGAPPHTLDPTAPLLYSSHVATGPVDLQSLWAGTQGAASDVTAAKERGDKWLEQFEGNIPGYISYFLNPDMEEEEGGCFVGGRARRRRGAGQGGARRTGTGERRARRPRAKAGGRGGFAQTVDLQEVGVSRLHKVFLQRSGPSRAGQGGGAVGRKLNLKTRELLRSTKTRRRRGKVWEFSQSGDVLTNSECGGAGGGRGGGGRRGEGSNTQKFNQDGHPVATARRARTKPAASVSFSCPSPSPAASTRPPSLCLPPPAPPPNEEQPEHFDRLLEEVMMGLDILPISNSTPHPAPAVGGGYSTCGDTSVQNKGRTRAPSRGLHGSTRVTAKAREDGEQPVLQQQGEGELSEMLEHFLQSFEQHVDSCTARAAEEEGGESCQATPPKNTEEAQVIRAAANKRRRWKKNKYPFSRERKRAGKLAALSAADAAAAAARRDEQLRQLPVVKLERSGPLPDRVILHKLSCPEIKSPTKAKAGSSSVKYPQDSLIIKTYPIRSRLTGAHGTRSLSVLKEPCRIRRGRPEGKPNCCPDNANKEVLLLSLSHAESSSPTIEQLEKNRERRDKEHAEGVAKGVGKREAEEEDDESSGIKRIRSEHSAPRVPETSAASVPSARETQEAPQAVRCRLPAGEQSESEAKLGQAEDGSTDEQAETPDVDGVPEDDRCHSGKAATRFVSEAPPVSPHVRSAREESVPSAGGWEEDEDVDVIGASVPVPEPVLINWSSEGEEEDGDEDIDVV
ncbi:uncharacterized protein LOC119211550 [Pungitius pungitius]|uniref:uncharacterized protein LOC119211550 n=1 Tax=Pungitius pungitius TaxID=134920 RepID=UPI002E141751